MNRPLCQIFSVGFSISLLYLVGEFREGETSHANGMPASGTLPGRHSRVDGSAQAAAPREAEDYTKAFQEVSDKSITAFALPGGPTFVNTGLITAAGNEAQLAGVMAHEISHVVLRHGTNQATKANLIQLPALLAGSLAGKSLAGQLAPIGIGFGANSVLLKYSRNAERDADFLGARLLYGAGHNPVEMMRCFEKLNAESGSAAQLHRRFIVQPRKNEADRGQAASTAGEERAGQNRPYKVNV
jgi:predicted Zn-dependent protease